MDFELSPDQAQIVDAVNRLLRRHAGPTRARELLAEGGYDDALDAALEDAGFSRVARAEGGGPLEGALVLEAVAEHAGLVAFGTTALVAPAVLGERPPGEGPVAIAVAGAPGPVRYGAHARTLLLLDGERARVRALRAGEARVVRSSFGFPMAEIPTDGGDVLDDAAAPALRAWWRVALAIEIVGTMRAAIDRTVAHVKERRQFGRPLGAFQALQHRLAECTVLALGARWLALEAAFLHADAARAELAATQAAVAAKRVFREAHQLHGAMGLTREHDLFLWSTRLPALGVEVAAIERASS